MALDRTIRSLVGIGGASSSRVLNLLAIGILGEYMARIYEEVKARPRYRVATLRNLGDRSLETPEGETYGSRV